MSNQTLRQRIREVLTSKKWMYTFLILFTFCTMGNNFNILSPALRDLTGLEHWNTTSEVATLVYTYRSVGYTLGALVAGVVYSYLNRQLIISILLSAMGIIAGYIPLMSSTSVAFPLFVLMGATSGALDTGLNVWMIELWGSDSAPFVLALWFSFSVGNSVAPLIVGPYLSPFTDAGSSSSSPDNSTTTAMPVIEGNSNLGPPFIITAVGGLLSAGLMHVTYWFCQYRSEAEVGTKFNENENEKDVSDTSSTSSTISGGPMIRTKAFKASVIIASTCLITAYNAIDVCHFEFLPLYLTSPSFDAAVKMSDQQASYLTSALSISSMASRGVGIFIALKLRPSLFLYGDLTLMAAANVILLAFSSTSQTASWVGNILLGLSFGTFFPSVLAYTERLIVISDMIGGFFIFSSGLTAAIIPIFLGKWIDTLPAILIYSNLLFTCLCAGVLVSHQVYLSHYNRSANQRIPIVA